MLGLGVGLGLGGVTMAVMVGGINPDPSTSPITNPKANLSPGACALHGVDCGSCSGETVHRTVFLALALAPGPALYLATLTLMRALAPTWTAWQVAHAPVVYLALTLVLSGRLVLGN